MLMKNFWDRATELGSRAKTMATGYLQQEKKIQQEIEEIEKIYKEKFATLASDIEIYKNEALKSYEENLSALHLQIEQLKNEKEENQILLQNKIDIQTVDFKNEENKLKAKLKDCEDKILLLEKGNQDLLCEIACLKEKSSKESFLCNMEDLSTHVNSINTISEQEIDLSSALENIQNYFKQENKEEFLLNQIKSEISQGIADNLRKTRKAIEDITTIVNENIEILKSRLDKQSEYSQDLSIENGKLNQEKVSIEWTLESSRRTIEEMRKEITDVTMNKEKTEKEFQKLTEQFKDQVNQISSLESEKKELKTLNERNQSIINDLTSKNEELRKLNENSVKSLTNVKKTFKQFFLMALEDKLFIDMIEKTFRESNSEQFFENVYKLSKMIKPKVIFSFYNSLLLNEDLKNSIPQIETCAATVKKLQAFSILNSLDQLDQIPENVEESSMLVSNLISELSAHIGTLNDTINKQSKAITDLTGSLKSMRETLVENKKHDSDKYELLNKHISKLQQDCRESVKTEKTLRENIETLENINRDLKTEIDKLSVKLKCQNSAQDDLIKEKSSLLEKISSCIQQCEAYKAENIELNEKIAMKTEEYNQLKDRTDFLTKEKVELLGKFSETDTLKATLTEKTELLSLKEDEISKLKSSYMDLEAILEKMKQERDISFGAYQKQMIDMTSEIASLHETIRLNDEKYQMMIETSNNSKIEEMEKTIADLENENKGLKDSKEKIKKYSEEVLMKVKNDLQETEYLIDKRMISSVLIKYFDKSTSDKLKVDLLDTLANFMGYTNDERRQIGLPSNRSQPHVEVNSNDKLKEMSDELYNFILNA